MSGTIPALRFSWDGEAMRPLSQTLADRHYTIGETYMLEPFLERSRNSHNHYFAAVHEAWLNLREEDAERFPTEDHLRKYALIRTGYRDERTIACASQAEALRVAAFVRPMDEYAVVIVREAVVVVWTAQSQSMKAMGKEVFQKSKTDVLDFLAAMIGTAPETLRASAGAAA